MDIVMKYVVSCESFGLEEIFQGIWFGHVFSIMEQGLIKIQPRKLNILVKTK
jgi:hypothetical protein